MYTLYHSPFSQHARRVHALLLEAKLEHELRHVAMDRAEHLSPEYRAINPNHQVPTLIAGDLKLHESNAILRYLCLRHDLEPWYPRALDLRARVEQWLDWNQSQLARAVVDIVLNTVFLGEHGDRVALSRGRRRLRELAVIVEEHLRGRDFLVGPQATIADLSLASNMHQLALADSVPKGEWTRRWLDRVTAIEGYRRALPPAISTTRAAAAS